MKNLSTHFTVVKNAELKTNFTIIDNRLLWSSIKLSKIILLCIFESLPNNWKLNLNYISKNYNIPYTTVWRLYHQLVKDKLLKIEDNKIYINYEKIFKMSEDYNKNNGIQKAVEMAFKNIKMN